MKVLKCKYRCVLAIMVLLFSNASGVAQMTDPRFDEYMSQTAKLGRFNGYVMIARDGKPIFSKGYGMANFEDDVPNNAQTKFRLASITKSFTAMAVMILQERGTLNLQDPVCKHLAGCPETWKAVTVRHLLDHTSGIPDYAASPDFMRTISLRLTPDALVASFKNKPLQSAPGEGFAYSNSNYILLGKIIEKTSGEPFADFLQANIFGPLGMKNSGYDDNRRILKHRAAGYIHEGGKIINAQYMDMSNAYAAGGLYSTAEDLLIWSQALDGEKLVTKKSFAEIFTPGKGEVGYGWFINREANRRIILQGGLNSGFASAVVRYPDERVSIILLNNLENAALFLTRIRRDLAAIVFNEKYELPSEAIEVRVDAKNLDAFVGEYDFGPGRAISVTKEGDKLFMQRGGAPKSEMFAESDTKFFLKIADVKFVFVKDSKGKITEMVLHANGQEFRGSKVK